MIITLCPNYLEVFEKYLENYTDICKKQKFVLCLNDLYFPDLAIRYEHRYSNEDVSKVMLSNGIKDFTIIKYSDILDKLSSFNFSDKFLKLIENMIGPSFLPWYVNKYIDNTDDILFVEEDVLVRFSENYVNKLKDDNKNYGYFYGTFADAIEGNEKYGKALCEIQGIEDASLKDQYKNVSFRHVAGAPQYYKKESFEGYDDYLVRLAKCSNELYDVCSKSKSWHHMYIDEYIKSCSPVKFTSYDSSIMRWSCEGKKGIVNYNPNYNKMWNNCILHLAGSFKVEKLQKILNNIKGGKNGNIL